MSQSYAIFGEENLPDGAEWSGGSSSSECQILATPANSRLWVERIVAKRAPPALGDISLCVSAFDVETSWRIDKATRAGIVSSATLAAGSNAPQIISVDPPLKIERGQYVGVWDADGMPLQFVHVWRRALTAADKGFWVAKRPAASTASLSRWLRYGTSWYAVATGCPPVDEAGPQGQSIINVRLGGPPLIRESTEQERAAKQEWLSREMEAAEDMILD
eukprot:GEMP01099661.1.p1 GENE.GEMP01099661.1~~GEMP01099661.1.p1  ORF type:complete len:219 (+),score=50.39 GEMP01099661.1:38-694(+)